MRKKRKRKKKIPTRKILLPIIVIMILLYTAIAIVLQFTTQTEISSTLTTCFFTFWTIEIVALAGITIKKPRSNFTNDYATNIEESEVNENE